MLLEKVLAEKPELLSCNSKIQIRYTTILDGEVVLKSAGYATILGDNRDKSV